MSNAVMGLAPAEKETLQQLDLRRGAIIHALNTTGTWNGVALKKDDPQVQLVLKALAHAILQRRQEAAMKKDEPRRQTRPIVGENGKTAKKVEAIRGGQRKPDDVRQKERANEERARRSKTMGKKGG